MDNRNLPAGLCDVTEKAESLLAATSQDGASDKRPKFTLTHFRDLHLSTAPDYLIKGMLPAEGMVVAWGRPKSGKSFWALDAALHVALGWTYRGRRVRAGAVVYIAGEGQSGFKKRKAAWSQEMQPCGDPPFYLIGDPVNLIGDHSQLIADIERAHVAPSLVVLDTLNRTLVGSESRDEDMAAYIAASDAIRDKFKCCVLIIHHCGLDGTRPRGHSSLSGAVDAQFSLIKGTDGLIAVTTEYVKDGPEGDVTQSRLRTVEVGVDDDGDPITSCVIEPNYEPQQTGDTPNLKGNQRTMFMVLHDAGKDGLTWREWSDRATEAGVGRNREATRFDVRGALLKKGLVYCSSQSERWFVKHG